MIANFPKRSMLKLRSLSGLFMDFAQLSALALINSERNCACFQADVDWGRADATFLIKNSFFTKN